MSRVKPIFFSRLKVVEEPSEVAKRLKAFLEDPEEDFTVKLAFEKQTPLEELFVSEPEDQSQKDAVEWFRKLDPDAALAQLVFRYQDWQRDQRRQYFRSTEPS